MWYTVDIIEILFWAGQIESKLGILSIRSLQFISISIKEEENVTKTRHISIGNSCRFPFPKSNHIIDSINEFFDGIKLVENGLKTSHIINGIKSV